MKHPERILLVMYCAIAAFTIQYFNGTGDSGDSVLHYLFARYAPAHPHLFFDHWAKPLFVLLASPFAQFGLTGIKVFNALVVFFTMLITYRVALLLSIENAFLVILFMMFSPLYYILTFSGLTEPLFALLLIISFYFVMKEQALTASFLVSFMPFVRSEGLIIIGVFAIYFLFKKNLRALILLVSGSVLYSIAGYFVHHNFLWVLSKIPYASLSSPYGSGKAFHFVEQLVNVTGIPVYILFGTGLILMLVHVFKRNIKLPEHVVVLGGFLCFFIAHSLFWYFGIFNSMGLKRVLIGVMPFIALIALRGYNFILTLIPPAFTNNRLVLQAGIIIYIVVFPFTPNPAAIQWKKDMTLSNDQLATKKVADFILSQKTIKYPLLYAHHYLTVCLEIDHFNESIHQELRQNDLKRLQSGQALVWDSGFTGSQPGMSLHELNADSTLKNIFTVYDKDDKNRVACVVYLKK